MARELSPEDQYKENVKELEALRSLLKSPAWPYLVREFDRVRGERADGLACVGVDPVTRAEHVQGYHDAKAFPNWPAERIEHLKREVRRFESAPV